MIKAGTKDIECRLYNNKRRKIYIVDTIIFSNDNKSFAPKIRGFLIAKDFKKLFSLIVLQRVDLKTYENAVKVMQEFYDFESPNKFGVVGIILEK